LIEQQDLQDDLEKIANRDGFALGAVHFRWQRDVLNIKCIESCPYLFDQIP
jgi:hypothetical protein